MTKTVTYQDLQDELDTLLIELQRDDLDVDQAIKYYERGLVLVQKLDARLKDAEIRITEIKAQFS